MLAGSLGVFTVMVACSGDHAVPGIARPVPISEWASRVDTLPGVYSSVGRPVEFHDSLLIVSDRIEGAIWRINLRSGTRQRFGSQGNGPGEYATAGRVAKLHRDSVAVLPSLSVTPFPIIDVTSGRGRSYSLAGAALAKDPDSRFGVFLSLPQLRAMDTLGIAYGAHTFKLPVTDSVTGRRLAPVPHTDTAIIVRVSLQGPRFDTLAHFYRGITMKPHTSDARGNMVFDLSLGPYGPWSEWHVKQDGTLVLVDAATYRVRVLSAGSPIEREFSLDWTPVAVSDSGWNAYVEQEISGSLDAAERSLDRVSAQLGKRVGGPKPWRYTVPPKPEALSPVNFQGGAQTVLSLGDAAWIPVHRADPPLTEFWDVVDLLRGERLKTLSLPRDQKLIALSATGAYVAARDDDDLLRILLYRAR